MMILVLHKWHIGRSLGAKQYEFFPSEIPLYCIGFRSHLLNFGGFIESPERYDLGEGMGFMMFSPRGMVGCCGQSEQCDLTLGLRSYSILTLNLDQSLGGRSLRES